MNYIAQLNTFYRFLPNNSLSSNAQSLYMFLLNYNNGLSWVKEFTVANTLICGYTNYNRQVLDRARNELVQKGYIQYRKGTSNQAGKYLIVEFDTQSDTQGNTQDGHRTIHKTDTEQYTERTQDDTRTVPLNKLNKTKLNIKEKIDKKEKATFQKPTVEEIKSYCEERNNSIDANKFFDFYESKGWKVGNNSMKDWKACVRTWEGRQNSVQPKTSNAYINNSQGFNDLDKFYTN